MSEFWIISNFLREHSYQDPEVHKICKAMAHKHLENEMNDLRATSVREDNIVLQIDVGNLRQVYQVGLEVIQAQSNSEALLSDYYDKQLEMMSMWQQEKIYEYDEIKAELEARDSIIAYEELCSRKSEMTRKMGERQIVKQYRLKEQDLLQTENDILNLEQKFEAKETETAEIQATIQDTILGLVKGSMELETVKSPTKRSESVEKKKTTAVLFDNLSQSNIFSKKPGLSSRLSIIFKPPRVPSAIVAPRIQSFNPTKGLDRLLEQAEILRRSVQISPDNSPPLLKPTIVSKDSKKEKQRKKVTFDLETPEPMSTDSPPEEADSVKAVAPDVTDSKPKPPLGITECVILENVVIKPPGAPLPVKATKDEKTLQNREPVVPLPIERKDEDVSFTANLGFLTKPKATEPPFKKQQLPLPVKISQDEETPSTKQPAVLSRKRVTHDHTYPSPSSPKKKRPDCESVKSVDLSLGLGDGRSFMDMLTDFSKDSTLEISSSSSTKADTPSTSDSKKPEEEKKIAESKEKKSKESLEGFEDFFASLTNVGSGCKDDDFAEADNSLDFFDHNDNTGGEDDGEDCDFSFKF